MKCCPICDFIVLSAQESYILLEDRRNQQTTLFKVHSSCWFELVGVQYRDRDKCSICQESVRSDDIISAYVALEHFNYHSDCFLSAGGNFLEFSKKREKQGDNSTQK